MEVAGLRSEQRKAKVNQTTNPLSHADRSVDLAGLVASCSMTWSESDACVAIRGTVVAATIGGIIVAMATPM